MVGTFTDSDSLGTISLFLTFPNKLVPVGEESKLLEDADDIM
jgi:hypothetical protein